MPEPAESPLLVLESAHVRRPDGGRSPALDARASGERVVLVGAWDFLFRLLTRELRLESGRAELVGVPIERALGSGKIGVARAEPVFVTGWTVRRYFTESASLLGAGKKQATARADALLAQFGFQSLGARRVDSLTLLERRSVAIVHATLGDPALLVFEQPLARLDSRGHDYLLGLLDVAAQGRRLLVSVRDPSSRERSLLDRADHTLVLDAQHGISEYRPEPATRVSATVLREADRFESALRARGLSVERLGPAPAFALLFAPSADAVRFTVWLDASADTKPVFDAANEAGASLVELVPA